MSDFPNGTRVTYEDEPIDDPAIIGFVTAPTLDEIAHIRTHPDGGYGPDFGDILVEWDGDHPAWASRSWQHPTDLQVLP